MVQPLPPRPYSRWDPCSGSCRYRAGVLAADSVPFALALFLGVVMIGTGVLIAVVNTRAADGRIGVNTAAGIRTKQTMAGEAAWRAAHVAAKPWNQFAAIIAVVTGFAVIALSSSAAALYGVLFTGLALSVAVVVAAAVVGHRAARAVNDGAG